MINLIIRGFEIHPKTQVKKCFEKKLKKEIWREKGNLMERPKKHQPSHWQTISHSDPQRPFLTNSTPPRFFSLFIFLSVSLSVCFSFCLFLPLSLSPPVSFSFCLFLFLSLSVSFSFCLFLSLSLSVSFSFYFSLVCLLPLSLVVCNAFCPFVFLLLPTFIL